MFSPKTSEQSQQNGQTSWRLDLLAVFLIGIGVALAFFPHLGTEDGLFFGDHRVVFRRRWWFVREYFSDLQFPGLTRASPAGVPLEAMLNGTYTPLTVLLFFADFDVSYDYFVAAHVFLLATGIYVLARRFQADYTSAIAVASLALAGPFLSFENLFVGLQGLAYCPWVLWAWLNLLRNPDLRRIAILGAVTGFQLQAIMPEILLLDLVGAGLIFLYCIKGPQAPRIVQTLGYGLGALSLALATASIELFPVLEYLQSSRRGSGFSYEEASLWSWHGKHSLEFFVPGFWYAPENPFSYFPEFTGKSDRPYLVSLYLGSFLALAAAAWHSKPTVKLFAALAIGTMVFSLLLASGDTSPLHGWLVKLPLFESTRYPIKFTLLFTAALGLLMALGLQASKQSPRTPLIAAAIQLVCVITIWSVMRIPEISVALETSINAQQASGAHFGIKASDYLSYAIPAMLDRIQHAVIFCGLVVTCLGLIIWRPQARFLLPLVLWLDLGLAAWYSIPTAPVATQTPQTLRKVLEHPHHRYYDVAPNGLLAPVTRSAGDTFFAAHMRSMLSRGSVLFKNAQRFEDFDSDAQSHPASSLAWSLLQTSQADQAERILGRSGVNKVTIWRKVNRPQIQAFDIPGDSPVYVFDVPKTRPYVRAYSDWRHVDLNDHARLRTLFTSEEYWDSGIVFDKPPSTLKAATSTTAQANCAAQTQTQLEATKSGEERIKVQMQSPCDSLVVALENYMQGWTVTVDKVAAEIIPAEFGMLGVFVPKGEHTIEFQYKPLLHRWIPVWLSGWLLVILLFVWPKRNKDVMLGNSDETK